MHFVFDVLLERFDDRDLSSERDVHDVSSFFGRMRTRSPAFSSTPCTVKLCTRVAGLKKKSSPGIRTSRIAPCILSKSSPDRTLGAFKNFPRVFVHRRIYVFSASVIVCTRNCQDLVDLRAVVEIAVLSCGAIFW